MTEELDQESAKEPSLCNGEASAQHDITPEYLPHATIDKENLPPAPADLSTPGSFHTPFETTEHELQKELDFEPAVQPLEPQNHITNNLDTVQLSENDKLIDIRLQDSLPPPIEPDPDISPAVDTTSQTPAEPEMTDPQLQLHTTGEQEAAEAGAQSEYYEARQT
jgi:hypothetical protein